MSSNQSSRDERLTVGKEIMDADGIAIRACFDPGLFTDRIPYDGEARWEGDTPEPEPMYRWQARAVCEALRLAGYDLTPPEGARPTPVRTHH